MTKEAQLNFKETDYQKFNLVKTVLKVKGKITINILGESMQPLYRSKNEVVDVFNVSELKDLKRFDVIIFWQDNILICHYFWGKNKFFNDADPTQGPTLLTRPLNPIKGFDHPIKFSQILGIIPERKIGTWLKFRVYWNLL